MVWYHRVTRARVLAEVPVLLGLGVAGGCAGAVLGPLMMDPSPLETPVLSRWAGEGLLAMRGFGLGWFSGLLAGLALIASARRSPTPPPPAAVARTGWGSIFVLVAAAVGGTFARWPPVLTFLAALAAATAAAKFLLSWEARRATRRKT